MERVQKVLLKLRPWLIYLEAIGVGSIQVELRAPTIVTAVTTNAFNSSTGSGLPTKILEWNSARLWLPAVTSQLPNVYGCSAWFG